jgi:hypothetical protein
MVGPRRDRLPVFGRGGDRLERPDVVAEEVFERALGEIGEVLGVTESRVSQLHTRAILWARPREPAET